MRDRIRDERLPLADIPRARDRLALQHPSRIARVTAAGVRQRVAEIGGDSKRVRLVV